MALAVITGVPTDVWLDDPRALVTAEELLRRAARKG